MRRNDNQAINQSNESIRNQLIHSVFDARDQELEKPVVFRASFNRFEPVNLSQAWSLWVTGCRNDALFGLNPAVGWFVTASLIAGLTLIALQRQSFGLL